MPSHLSPQWLCGNSCTWAQDVPFNIAGTNEKKSPQKAKEGAKYQSPYVIHDTQSAQISQKQDEGNIYVIMKTMCTPGYHHNGFVETQELGHVMYGSILLVPMNQRMLNRQSRSVILVVISDSRKTVCSNLTEAR